MSIDRKNILWPGWETVGLIGRGNFGAVYEIERDILGTIEKAALKVISIPQHESDIEEMYNNGYDEESVTSTFKYHLKSIVEEYSMMRKMSECLHIVSCDDVRFVQHDDGIGWDIFIKMELLTPLTKALPVQVTEETVLKVAKDLCSALDACKQYNIVHRDIKPQNIFCSPAGNYKLGDFGIAKTVEKTMGGTKIGTYSYMAPEVNNNKPYGSGADIYSLGLVLYWLLNERRMPFLPLPPAKLRAGMDEEARNRRLAGEQFAEPKNGSRELKAIVMKACAYNLEDRYASAAEMLEDLNQIGQRAVPQPRTAAVILPPAEATADLVEIEDADVTISVFRKRDGAVVPGVQPEAEQTVQEPEKKTEVAQSDLKEGQSAPENEPVSRELSRQEEETWRRSEAAHRAWQDSRESQSASPASQKQPKTVGDVAFSALRQAHEYWTKKHVVPQNETQVQKDQLVTEDENVEAWRKSEAAYRAWQESQKPQISNPVSYKQPKDVGDDAISVLRQAHEHWAKKLVEPQSETQVQKDQPVLEGKETETWRKSEAAHRAWLESADK